MSGIRRKLRSRNIKEESTLTVSRESRVSEARSQEAPSMQQDKMVMSNHSQKQQEEKLGLGFKGEQRSRGFFARWGSCGCVLRSFAGWINAHACVVGFALLP